VRVVATLREAIVRGLLVALIMVSMPFDEVPFAGFSDQNPINTGNLKFELLCSCFVAGLAGIGPGSTRAIEQLVGKIAGR